MRIFTQEHKRKISESLLGNKRTLGKKLPPFTEEHRKKISEGLKKRGIIPPNQKGIKKTLETRKKMSVAQKGEKSCHWKGGITPINHKIRGSLEYKLWRKAVKERDNFTCIWCGSKKQIEADHVKPFSLFPELRFAIDNGRTLCRECHKTTDTYGLKLQMGQPSQPTAPTGGRQVGMATGLPIQ